MKANTFVFVFLLLAGVVWLVKNKILNQPGVDLIKEFESFSATVYTDEAGNPTIGYGHLIKQDEGFTAITREEGERLLRADAEVAERAVNKNVKVKTSQNMFNALVSLVFNIGVTAFGNSTLLRKLNEGDYQGAFDEFTRWNKITRNGNLIISAGLSNRRAEEQEVFFA